MPAGPRTADAVLDAAPGAPARHLRRHSGRDRAPALDPADPMEVPQLHREPPALRVQTRLGQDPSLGLERPDQVGLLSVGAEIGAANRRPGSAPPVVEPGADERLDPPLRAIAIGHTVGG